MKNIYILPTDKPSRLVQRRITKELKFSLMDNPQLWNNINIYITSDEEIKEGDWYYDLDTKYVKIKQSWENSHLEFNSKKIILTTDVDLIKGGVQSINDEFLEWFVKNPSCEWVEVESINIGDGKLGYIICKPKDIQRMYSEEEVRSIIKIYSHADNQLSIGEILEQVKKK